MLCPVVFSGRTDEAERAAEGCLEGVAETGAGAG